MWQSETTHQWRKQKHHMGGSTTAASIAAASARAFRSTARVARQARGKRRAWRLSRRAAGPRLPGVQAGLERGEEPAANTSCDLHAHEDLSSSVLRPVGLKATKGIKQPAGVAGHGEQDLLRARGG